MILPPKSVSEFLVFRPAESWEYEVFVFPAPIIPILDGYSGGKAIDPIIAKSVKSYIFEGNNEVIAREALRDWVASIGMEDPETVVIKARSWRLAHCMVPSVCYQTDYQGHPVRTEDWRRIATPVREAKKKRVDPFDPLQMMQDLTFSIDEFI